LVAAVEWPVTMTATTGLHGRSGRSAWQLAHLHACWPFRRRACLNDRSCAPLVPGTSPEGPTSRPVSRPKGTKIDCGQRESEAQPLAVLIVSDSYQRLLKIGTVTRPSLFDLLDFERRRWSALLSVRDCEHERRNDRRQYHCNRNHQNHPNHRRHTTPSGESPDPVLSRSRRRLPLSPVSLQF
jgi:hypothetical protein